MYPVSLGFKEAERRIRELLKNGHHAEALVTSVFTFEKTLRRALRCCAVRRGFSSKHAETLFEGMGFKDLKEVWPCFSPGNSVLPGFVGPKGWQHIPEAVTMRNKLAHGTRAYKLVDCKAKTESVLDVLSAFRNKLKAEIGFDGWARIPVRRESKLPWLV